jgi:hypothetical protein
MSLRDKDKPCLSIVCLIFSIDRFHDVLPRNTGSIRGNGPAVEMDDNNRMKQ